MALRKIRDRFNRRQAERIFLEAQRALLVPQKPGVWQIVAYVVSAIILLLPVFFFCLGLWTIYVNWFNIPALIIGALLAIFGYVLFPRYNRNLEKTFTRKDLPELYRVLDAISDKIGTSPPDGVHLFDDINAYAASFGRVRKERVIGLGIPLWRMMTPQERIAILAHEMAHFVNGDPARGNITGAALQTVEEWDYFLAPNVLDGDYHRDWTEAIAELIQLVLRLPILFLGYILLFVTFNRSQRAEYLADGLAAQVSGVLPMQTALKKFDLTPLIEKEIQKLYPFRDQQDGRIFDVMATAVNDAHPDDVKNLEAKAAEKKQRIDDSHPPTLYRVGFLDALGDMTPLLDAQAFDFEQIDAELAEESDRLGKKLMQMYEDTTM